MKITSEQIVDQNNLLGHIILNSIGNFPDICKAISKKGHGELKMTIDGIEIDIESFVKHWQSQVSRIVTDKAMEIVEEQMRDLSDTVCNFGRALNDKIEELYKN